MPNGREREAEAYYAGVLGIPRVPKPVNLEVRGGCWFRSDSVEIHLGVEDPFLRAHKAHPAFLVDDLDALMSRLTKVGYPIEIDEPVADFRRFYSEDPFGNRIEFLSAKS